MQLHFTLFRKLNARKQSNKALNNNTMPCMLALVRLLARLFTTHAMLFNFPKTIFHCCAWVCCESIACHFKIDRISSPNSFEELLRIFIFLEILFQQHFWLRRRSRSHCNWVALLEHLQWQAAIVAEFPPKCYSLKNFSKDERISYATRAIYLFIFNYILVASFLCVFCYLFAFNWRCGP